MVDGVGSPSLPRAPVHDVAVYSPLTAGLFDRATRRAPGGAELQTALLASTLASRGLRVVLIVFPLEDPVLPNHPGLTILQRARHAGRGRVAKVLEGERMWRALQRADARVCIVRTGTPAAGLAAVFCRVRRRAFVFSSAGTNDFTFDDFAATPLRLRLYRLGVRAAHAVVVQTREQIDFAREAFPEVRRVVEIPSFVEVPPVGASEPEAFLWIGRLVARKQPLAYVELARALPDARFRMIAVEGIDSPPALAAELRGAAAAVPNLELLAPRSHAETGDLMARAVASVNTSESEGMPNAFLEAWARGVPALSLNIDPDGRIVEHQLGIAANGSWQRFVAGARDLWNGRHDRSALSQRVRSYVQTVHSPAVVGARWQALVDELGHASARRWRPRASGSGRKSCVEYETPADSA